MAAPLTVPKPPEASGMDTNFSALIDYDKLFDSLALNGIPLSDHEKERLKKITATTMDKYDNSVFSGMGGSNLLNLLFAFLGSVFGGKGPTDFSDLGAHLSASNDKAVAMSKLRQLHFASREIHHHMLAEGGNLAAAAGLVTAVHENGQPYQPLKNSLYDQLIDSTGMPPGSSSTLASLAAEPTVQTDLPRQARTEGLTQRG